MKRDGRKLPKTSQQEVRKLAITYWLKNKNMREAAAVFNVSYSALRKWVRKFNASGKQALSEDRRGRPAGKEFSSSQERSIIRKITTKQPDQLKLSFGLWTRENVAELIYREFGIRRSVWQIGRYLSDWGFTAQKPIYKAYQQQSEAVKQWLEEIYPRLKRKAKQARAMIFWGDETGMRSRDNRGRSFAPAGKTPVIKKTGRQFGFTMISAVNNRGKLYFMIFQGGVNAEKFLRFLRKLIVSRKERIFLIIDNLPAHKTKQVKEWIWNYRNRIRLFYLPPYSPELNPDEYLNQDLKENITGKIRMNDAADLKNGMMKFMYKRKRNPKQVRKYFHPPSVQYAA